MARIQTKRPKHGYRWPLRSRKAMTEYILDDSRSYCDHHTRYTFSWNVKAHSVDWDRPEGEYAFSEQRQEAWEAHVAKHSWVSETAFEDARRHLVDDEYTTYPGDDQGDWKFEFMGRSGGHLVLVGWSGSDHIRSLDEETLSEWTFAEVRQLYRALVCMDHDFTPAKASENIEYHLNFLRMQWEEEQEEKEQAYIEKTAARIEAERPDLYNLFESEKSKSQIIRELAEARGIPFVEVQLSDIDTTGMFLGVPTRGEA